MVVQKKVPYVAVYVESNPRSTILTGLVYSRDTQNVNSFPLNESECDFRLVHTKSEFKK